MTAQEQASLDRLALTVDEGFREVRELMEARRVEEVRVKDALDGRLRSVERIAYTATVIGTFGTAVAIAIYQSIS